MIDTIPDKEQEEAKKRRNTALGLLGAGTGLAGLGHLVLDRRSENNVHDLVGGYNALNRAVGSGAYRSHDANHLIVRGYGEAGNQALGTRVFGMPARLFVERLRSGPWMNPDDRWKGESSATHYDAFNRGPLYGYLQMLNETAEKTNVLGSKNKTDKFLAQLIEKTNEASRAAVGADAVVDDGQNMTRRLGWGLQNLSIDDQRRVLDQMGDKTSFTGAFSPLFRNRYRRLLGATAPGAMESYKKYGLKMGLPVLKAKNLALGGGLLLAGAGAGLGIQHILRSLRERKARRAAKNRLATEPQIA